MAEVQETIDLMNSACSKCLIRFSTLSTWMITPRYCGYKTHFVLVLDLHDLALNRDIKTTDAKVLSPARARVSLNRLRSQLKHVCRAHHPIRVAKTACVFIYAER